MKALIHGVRQVLESKQIAISKDTMRNCQLVKKCCYSKNGLTYPSKDGKSLLYLFKKEKKIVLFSLENYTQYMLCHKIFFVRFFSFFIVDNKKLHVNQDIITTFSQI